MKKKSLEILAKITKNTPVVETTNTENPMLSNYLVPAFPANWLAPTEVAAILTVTRGNSVVQYLTCTHGAQYIEGHIPNTDGGFWSNEVRNTRDWDYLTRLLALNGYLQAGDIVEVKSKSGYMPVFRNEITDLDFPNWWSYCGVRQPIENVLVSMTFRSCRFPGDRGLWADRFTGKTHPITGIVEPDLSRW